MMENGSEAGKWLHSLTAKPASDIDDGMPPRRRNTQAWVKRSCFACIVPLAGLLDPLISQDCKTPKRPNMLRAIAGAWMACRRACAGEYVDQRPL